MNVLCQHGDARATELLLADWERRRKSFGDAKISWNNEVIPALVRCKDGAALPALLKGWAAYPMMIRTSILYAVQEMIADPGHVVDSADHRRRLSELALKLLNDKEEFKGEKTWVRGKNLFPYERICDLAAEIRIPDQDSPPVFNPEAPRGERDKVIGQSKERWLEFARQGR